MTAVADCVPARNVARALPPSVRASLGSTTPTEDVNVTSVPLWTGVPAGSITVAVSSAVPLIGSVVVLTESVTVDSTGASNGTLSHAEARTMAAAKAANAEVRDTDEGRKYSICMGLGQGNRPSGAAEAGYAMAALLVGLSVMAVLMSMALPVWTTFNKREREAELIWRGQQYARAIGLFQRKYANTYPPNVDLLVEQKFLRKKYKDPITNEDFQMIPAGGGPNQPGGPQNSGGKPPNKNPQPNKNPSTPPGKPSSGPGGSTFQGGSPAGQGGSPAGQGGFPAGQGGFPAGQGGSPGGPGRVSRGPGRISRGRRESTVHWNTRCCLKER